MSHVAGPEAKVPVWEQNVLASVTESTSVKNTLLGFGLPSAGAKVVKPLIWKPPGTSQTGAAKESAERARARKGVICMIAEFDEVVWTLKTESLRDIDDEFMEE